MAEGTNVVMTDAQTTVANVNDIIPGINDLQLKSVLDDLTDQDYVSIFFLLIDYISEDEFLKITKEKKDCLKQKLDQSLKTIGSDSYSILLELFATMKLHKMSKTIGSCHHILKKVQEMKICYIDDIWKMCYSLCEELNDADLEVLKQFFSADERNKIASTEEWFVLALQKQIFSRTDFSNLQKIFQYHQKCLDIIRKYDRPKCYEIRTPTVHEPCGIAIILNYERFSVNYEERKGSSNDVKSLKEVWSRFGFETYIYNNLTCKETHAILKKYADLDHSDYDAFVCCILSHGLSNTVISSDGIRMSLPDLIAVITNNCISLHKKPKLFFVQACQGNNVHEGIGKPIYQCKPTDETLPPVTFNCAPPIASDLLLAMSSIDGYVSFRSPTNGSWFINAFCKVMLKKGHQSSILDVMIEVNNIVREHSGDFGPGGPRSAKQIVNCYNTFRKTVILKKIPV